MKKFVSVLLALVACIAFSGVAHAGSATTSFPVTLIAIVDCQVSSNSVNFGDVFDGTTTANGDVSVKCSAYGAPYGIYLDAGENYDGSKRRVSNGFGNTIEYGLYQDSAYSVEWGDNGSGNTYPLGESLWDTANASWQSHTVYGQMTVSPGAIAGNYSDNVTVTVYF